MQLQGEIKKACTLYFSDRIPVVSKGNKPLMPCKPSKARKLLEQNKAIPRWSKLGLFYIQLTIEITSERNKNQFFILAHDPGSKFDGFALGFYYVQLRVMAVMPDEIADKRKPGKKGKPGKMGARANLRRARRYRNTRRRPWRPRSPGPDWIAPSQLAKVLFRLAIVRELCKLFPVKHFIVEDVKFDHYNKRYGKYFSTVEIGKSLYYRELRALGTLTPVEGWQTAEWRKMLGVKKSSRKDALVPESHANDAVAMLAGVVGCKVNDCAPFWVYRRPEFARRSLHRQNFQKGGVRLRFGGTCNGGYFRKGDYVEAKMAGKIYRGWVCGLPTEKTPKVGVQDARGNRIGQFVPSKVHLLQRSGNILWERVI